MAPAEASHPHWCDRQHPETYRVHTRDIDGDDLPLDSERDLAVLLHQEAGEPVRVWIVAHGRMVSEVTPLTANVARELADGIFRQAK
jgi:hypothetical protein